MEKILLRCKRVREEQGWETEPIPTTVPVFSSTGNWNTQSLLVFIEATKIPEQSERQLVTPSLASHSSASGLPRAGLRMLQMLTEAGRENTQRVNFPSRLALEYCNFRDPEKLNNCNTYSNHKSTSWIDSTFHLFPSVPHWENSEWFYWSKCWHVF